MRKKIIRFFFIGLIILGLLFLSTVYIISPYYIKKNAEYNSIKEISTKYYYYINNDSTDIRDGLYINNISESDLLIEYYRTLNDTTEPSIFFGGSIFFRNKPIYILDFIDNDSLIAKVIDSNNHKAYIYVPLLHKEKP